MQQLITDTPQWRIMVEQGVFVPREMSNNNKIEFGELTIEPILVPHRDELSDMHAFVISTTKISCYICLTTTLGKKHCQCIIVMIFDSG